MVPYNKCYKTIFYVKIELKRRELYYCDLFKNSFIIVYIDFYGQYDANYNVDCYNNENKYQN